jgi:hypothetical protein
VKASAGNGLANRQQAALADEADKYRNQERELAASKSSGTRGPVDDETFDLVLMCGCRAACLYVPKEHWPIGQ